MKYIPDILLGIIAASGLWYLWAFIFEDTTNVNFWFFAAMHAWILLCATTLLLWIIIYAYPYVARGPTDYNKNYQIIKDHSDEVLERKLSLSFFTRRENEPL